MEAQRAAVDAFVRQHGGVLPERLLSLDAAVTLLSEAGRRA